MFGRFLTEGMVNYEIMKDTLSKLWRLGKGICITKLEPNLFLFMFFHEFDMNWVIESGP